MKKIPSLKGTGYGHEINIYFVRSMILNRYRTVLYVTLLVSKIFCSIAVEKIKFKVLACSFETNFKMLSVTLFRDPKAAILTLKTHTYMKPPVIL